MLRRVSIRSDALDENQYALLYCTLVQAFQNTRAPLRLSWNLGPIAPRKQRSDWDDGEYRRNRCLRLPNACKPKRSIDTAPQSRMPWPRMTKPSCINSD